jgi:hypothetical protein
MSCQIYWQMYQSQSARRWYMRGAPVHFSGAVRDVLNNTYNDWWILGIGGLTAWPPRSPEFRPLDFYLWVHLKLLMHGASLDNKETIALWMPVRLFATNPESKRIRSSVMRRLEACIEFHGGRLLYICNLSAVTHQLSVSGQVLIWTFVQNLFAPFTYSLYILQQKMSRKHQQGTKLFSDFSR